MNAMKHCQATIRIRWFKCANVPRNISVQFSDDAERHDKKNYFLFILQPHEHDW